MTNLYDELQLRPLIEDATAKFRFVGTGRLEVSDMEKYTRLNFLRRRE